MHPCVARCGLSGAVRLYPILAQRTRCSLAKRDIATDSGRDPTQHVFTTTSSVHCIQSNPMVAGDITDYASDVEVVAKHSSTRRFAGETQPAAKSETLAGSCQPEHLLIKWRTGIAAHHSRQHQPREPERCTVHAEKHNKPRFCGTYYGSNTFLGTLQR
jgi:hypothetical protein